MNLNLYIEGILIVNNYSVEFDINSKNKELTFYSYKKQNTIKDEARINEILAKLMDIAEQARYYPRSKINVEITSIRLW